MANVHTDPVCGMPVDADATDFHHEHAGTTFHFCTSVCRDQFLQHPERYQIAGDDVSAMRSEGEAGVSRTSGRASAPRISGESRSLPASG
ncbi:MAG: YHS domain-containing protein [Planctomycetes bacterium]|nr:YHS domain-containing protein [Planctomycetota bacterium]